MKVRKGQSSIKLPSRNCGLASASWSNKRTFGPARKLTLVDYETWLTYYESETLLSFDSPSYATIFKNRVYFHPPAPCAGEIIVRYTTMHQI